MKKLITMLISLTVLSLSCVFAQNILVKGQVMDANGPAVGIAVLQEGTTNGTETDFDGRFEIVVPSSNTVLVFSFIGYKTLSIPASEASSVFMEVDQQVLEEVVVIGYGVVKKNDMTGSVSAVKADQVNRGVITSPSDLLAGKSAGVVVTTGDGQPGSASTIRVRGGSSLSASNDPLIVIDGLPISNEGVSGMSDQLSSINPSDIESFTVLKDASATAIYGSRASNGVIIITTKKGSKYDSAIPKINVDFTASLSQNTRYMDVLTGDEMRDAMKQYAINYQGYTEEDYQSYAGYAALGEANTDWQRAVYQMAQSYDANIGLQGNVKFGNAGNMPYRVSGGYLNQQGTLKTSKMERGTLALNLAPTLLDDHLKINLNAKGMIANNRFANQGAIGASAEYDPTQEIYDSSSNGLDGYRIWGTNGIPNTQSTSNPVASLEQRKDVSNVKRFIGNAQIDYKIHGVEDLRLNVNLGLDLSKSKGTIDTPIGCEQSWHSQLQSGSGYHEDYSSVKRDETLEAYIDYNPTFGKHILDIMGGYSWQHFYQGSDNKGVRADNGAQISGAEYKSEYYLVSFFGRLNYSFDDRYMLTATVRYDGTSRFANNKWGLFPSVALGWNIKNESFLKSSRAVSKLKLRLSWGETGQQDLNAGNYPTLPGYKYNLTGSYYQFGDRVIVPITPLGYNADLKWETTTTYNVGIDFGFIENRLTGSIDGYYRDTKDLLNYTPVAAGANLKNYISANIGSLVNYGVEVELNAVPIETRNWHWDIGLNAAWNKNEITKLTTNDGPNYKGVATGGISGGVGNYIQRFMVGYPVNSFYVYEQIYDTDGSPIMGAYVDRNEDGKIDSNDMYCYKKSAPDYTFGFNTLLTYKNWTFAASAHANIGNYVYDNNSSRFELLSDLWTNNFVANRMSTALYSGFSQAQYLSDYYVKDASFLKIDNITLGYLFHIGKIMSLNLFATVQNAFVFTNYTGIDPEIYSGIDNTMYPRPRTYLLGLKFNF
jgi:TonB-dependent starch-binding outer membrane protein SusC